MTYNEVMDFLASKGSEQTKKVLMNHGAREPFFGVKVSDLKVIQKKLKRNYALSLELFASGNSDAMYLAGMIAESEKMTREDLNRWANEAYWYYISEFAVPWVASENPLGWELAHEWINSETETKMACGWATFSSVLSIAPDEVINMDDVSQLLERIEKTIHQSPNRVRYTMNNFVIAAGSYCSRMNEPAKKAALQIGKVKVDMGGTACKVPYAPEYIEKVEKAGKLGQKRKLPYC